MYTHLFPHGSPFCLIFGAVNSSLVLLSRTWLPLFCNRIDGVTQICPLVSSRFHLALRKAWKAHHFHWSLVSEVQHWFRSSLLPVFSFIWSIFDLKQIVALIEWLPCIISQRTFHFSFIPYTVFSFVYQPVVTCREHHILIFPFGNFNAVGWKSDYFPSVVNFHWLRNDG